jgi:peroxiredoxin Q/BCP
MAHPKIGNLAPAFSLPNAQGATIKLKDYRGHHPVVLYFYPKAMTPGCTVQAQGLRDHLDEITALGAVVLGVSPDAPQRLAKFIERDALNFELLSDEDHAVATQYGAWGPKKFMGKEYDGILRTTYIIGADGKLRAILDKFKTKSHHEDVLAALAQL